MGKPSIELNFRRQISREHEQIIAQVRLRRAVSHSSLPLRRQPGFGDDHMLCVAATRPSELSLCRNCHSPIIPSTMRLGKSSGAIGGAP